MNTEIVNKIKNERMNLGGLLRISTGGKPTSRQLRSINDALKPWDLELEVWYEDKAVARDNLKKRIGYQKFLEWTKTVPNPCLVVAESDRLWSMDDVCHDVLRDSDKHHFHILCLVDPSLNDSTFYSGSMENKQRAYNSCFKNAAAQNSGSNSILDQKADAVEQQLYIGGRFSGWNDVVRYKCRYEGDAARPGYDPDYILDNNNHYIQDGKPLMRIQQLRNGYRIIDYVNGTTTERKNIPRREKENGVKAFIELTTIPERLDLIRFIFDTLDTEELSSRELIRRINKLYPDFWARGWSRNNLLKTIRNTACMGTPTIGKDGNPRYYRNGKNSKIQRNSYDRLGDVIQHNPDSHKITSTRVYWDLISKEQFVRVNEKIKRIWNAYTKQPRQPIDDFLKGYIFYGGDEIKSGLTLIRGGKSLAYKRSCYDTNAKFQDQPKINSCSCARNLAMKIVSRWIDDTKTDAESFNNLIKNKVVNTYPPEYIEQLKNNRLKGIDLWKEICSKHSNDTIPIFNCDANVNYVQTKLLDTKTIFTRYNGDIVPAYTIEKFDWMTAEDLFDEVVSTQRQEIEIQLELLTKKHEQKKLFAENQFNSGCSIDAENKEIKELERHISKLKLELNGSFLQRFKDVEIERDKLYADVELAKQSMIEKEYGRFRNLLGTLNFKMLIYGEGGTTEYVKITSKLGDILYPPEVIDSFRDGRGRGMTLTKDKIRMFGKK